MYSVVFFRDRLILVQLSLVFIKAWNWVVMSLLCTAFGLQCCGKGCRFWLLMKPIVFPNGGMTSGFQTASLLVVCCHNVNALPNHYTQMICNLLQAWVPKPWWSKTISSKGSFCCSNCYCHPQVSVDIWFCMYAAERFKFIASVDIVRCSLHRAL